MTKTDQQTIEKLKKRMSRLEKQKSYYKKICNQLRKKFQSQGPRIACHKDYRKGLNPETIARVWDALADEKSNKQTAQELDINERTVAAIRRNSTSYIAAREKALEEMDNLEFREREILRLRFGFVDGRQYTLQGIAEILDLSRERVRQIEIKALNKLRRWMKRGDV